MEKVLSSDEMARETCQKLQDPDILNEFATLLKEMPSELGLVSSASMQPTILVDDDGKPVEQDCGLFAAAKAPLVVPSEEPTALCSPHLAAADSTMTASTSGPAALSATGIFGQRLASGQEEEDPATTTAAFLPELHPKAKQFINHLDMKCAYHYFKISDA